MSFPSEKEINDVGHGDIITIRYATDNKDFIQTDNSSSYKEDEYISLKFVVVERDSTNWIVASIISFEMMPASLGGWPHLFKFGPDHYGEDEFNLIKSKLDQIKNPVSFDEEHTRFIADNWIFNIEKRETKIHHPDGLHCCECNEYYHYAVPNLSNGNLACWNCRDSYKWKYSELFMGNK